MKLVYTCTEVSKKKDEAFGFVYTASLTFKSMELEPGVTMPPPANSFPITTPVEDKFVPGIDYNFEITIS